MIIDELKKRMLIQKIVMLVTSPCIFAGMLGVVFGGILMIFLGVSGFYGAAVDSDFNQIVILTFAVSIVTLFIGYGIHRAKFMDSNCTSEEFNQLLLEEEIDQTLSDRFLNEHQEFKKEYQKQLLPDTDLTDGFYICKMTKL